jgi:hypothetical protein
MRYVAAVCLLLIGFAAGAALRPSAATAGSSFDPEERSARSLERIADALSEMKRGADRKLECDCRK